MGTLAHQATQLLNIQPLNLKTPPTSATISSQTFNPPTAFILNSIPSNTSVPIPLFNSLQPPNAMSSTSIPLSNSLPSSYSVPSTPIQMFTKQSTLDSHLAQHSLTSSNFSGSGASPASNLELDIVTLTPYQFSDCELEVLRFLLSFCPSTNLDKYELIKDIYMFTRGLTYRYMSYQDSVRANDQTKL